MVAVKQDHIKTYNRMVRSGIPIFEYMNFLILNFWKFGENELS